MIRVNEYSQIFIIFSYLLKNALSQSTHSYVIHFDITRGTEAHATHVTHPCWTSGIEARITRPYMIGRAEAHTVCPCRTCGAEARAVHITHSLLPSLCLYRTHDNAWKLLRRTTRSLHSFTKYVLGVFDQWRAQYDLDNQVKPCILKVELNVTWMIQLS
jgi:hypothetical protein